MVTYPNRLIRYGTAFHDGKLYFFRPRQGILVVSQWPDMRAWRKTPKGRGWKHVRPEMCLETTWVGWGCVCYPRETRQRDRMGGDHIKNRILHDFHQPDDFPQMEPLEEMEEDGYGASGVPAEEGSDMWGPGGWVELAQEREYHLQAEYLKPIPEEVLVAVSRFTGRHWHLLNLVARCPGAFDLVQSTPALALALSSLWVFRKNPPRQPLRAARSLLGKRQTDIAAWLGFPDSRSTVKILRKLPPAECTVLNLLYLRDLFRTHLHVLQHLPVLDGTLIRLMSGKKDRYQATPGFLQEIAATPELLSRTATVLGDTLWMREKLKDTGILALRSYNHLARVHDRFVGQMGRMDLKIIDPPPLPPFPPPPLLEFSPYLELEPLQTEWDLQEEGRVQQNCVGAYGPRVRQGGMYLYRLLAPERATLAVRMSKPGEWRLNEIKAALNSEVLPETLSTVLEWIDCAGRECSCDCEGVDMPF